MRKTLLWVLLAVTVTQAGAPTSGSTACPGSGNKRVRSTSTKAVTYVIQAPAGNSGTVCIGGPDVTTSTGACLIASWSVTGMPQGNSNAYDLSNQYMACTNSGDSVTWSFQ